MSKPAPVQFSEWTVNYIQDLVYHCHDDKLDEEEKDALEYLHTPCGNLVRELTEEQLKNEVARRTVLKAFDQRVRNLTNAKLWSNMSQKVIDICAPEHGRTSCSDQNAVNGWGSNGQDQPPRCVRCALLELIRGGKIPPNFRVTFQIEPVEGR